jgi:NADH dehydrogenase FAD-containing subunit
MAIIGRGSAITDLVWTRFDGLLAWFAWLFIHILMLIGFRNRLAGASSVGHLLHPLAAQRSPHYEYPSGRR